MIPSPPCSTFSRAPWRNNRGPQPLRSFDHPDELPGLRWSQRRKAQLGNNLADFSMRIAASAWITATCFWSNPRTLVPLLWTSALFHVATCILQGDCIASTRAALRLPPGGLWHSISDIFQADEAAAGNKAAAVALHALRAADLRRPWLLQAAAATARDRGPHDQTSWSPLCDNAEQWLSAFCKWVATTVLDDFLTSASTAADGDSLDTESESSEMGESSGGKIFRFNPVTESTLEPGRQLSEAEGLSLGYLKRGYELLQLSEMLPRIRESALQVEGQRSFTTGAYIHQEVVGLRRNLRNHRWASELLARTMAASFPGKVFSSLALFRDLKQPAHRDSTNGPWENLLLACTEFGGGGLWIQSDGGPVKRRIFDKDVEGKVLGWKKGKIAFDAHRWHSTEDWTGTRLVLAGYTVAGLENLGAGDRKLLWSRGFTLGTAPEKSLEPEVDPTWPPIPGGGGPARLCREPWGSKPFHDGAGLCSPGRWDPQQRKYCNAPGWEELRRRLEDIILDHAGGKPSWTGFPSRWPQRGSLDVGWSRILPFIRSWWERWWSISSERIRTRRTWTVWIRANPLGYAFFRHC